MALFAMTLGDFQGHLPTKAFQMRFFVQQCSFLLDFSWKRASRGSLDDSRALCSKIECAY